ncbi:MAG: hypothetical protein WCA07_09260 [Gloeobacterales cyanobacterium]
MSHSSLSIAALLDVWDRPSGESNGIGRGFDEDLRSPGPLPQSFS